MAQYLIQTDAHRPAAVGDVVPLPGDEARHLRTVMRTRPGQEIDLTDGRGWRYRGRLIASGKGDRPAVEIMAAARDAGADLAPQLAVAVGVVKGKRFEWALEKACELGAHRIVPLQTAFAVVVPRGNKQERWRGVLAAALKQCGRSLLPVLEEPTDLDGFLAGTEVTDELWFGASPAAERERGAVAAGDEPPVTKGGAVPREITVCIGPEGGFSAGEIAALGRAGARELDLGPHVLRTETAVAAALAVLQRRCRLWRAVAGAAGDSGGA